MVSNGWTATPARGSGKCRCSPPFFGEGCEVGWCQPGYRLDRNGDTLEACVLCESGKYKNHTGSEECSICPDGHVSVMNGTSCVACPGGTVPSADQSTCVPCPFGSMSISGSASCTPCEAGEVPSEEKSLCIPCKPGSVARRGLKQRKRVCN